MGKGNKYPQNAGAEIDLHGLTISEALESLDFFLKKSKEKNIESVRVITGKGLHSSDPSKTIKASAKEWLFENNYKFRYAKQNQGGEGALIVILF